MTPPDDSLPPAAPPLPGATILDLVDAVPELREGSVVFPAGTVILEEGNLNDRLHILLEGSALLRKRDTDGRLVDVDTFDAGSLLGLTSFWSRSPVFARIEAASAVSCIAIDREAFDRLMEQHRPFVQVVQNLFVHNLSNRYRNMIRFHMERERLAAELEQERNQLRTTLHQLEQTTNRLVNQEKLATLGQLLAGIAHEINNPVGALLRGVDAANEAMAAAFQGSPHHETEGQLLAEGLACPFWSSEEKRERMSVLLADHPGMSRPLARRLAQLTDAARDLIGRLTGTENEALGARLAAYELGVSFRAVRLSATRIESIVTSLRNYGRQSSTMWEDADMVQGIRDTLTVLNNRLKHYDLQLDLQPLVAFPCNLGEINQIWTNLLTNAMDATPRNGYLLVTTFMDGDTPVVRIADSGTGINPDKLEQVFEPNYTSKNQNGTFGLGLGLSISRDIALKHGGSLTASNRPEGGACFEARFPPGRA